VSFHSDEVMERIKNRTRTQGSRYGRCFMDATGSAAACSYCRPPREQPEDVSVLQRPFATAGSV
jgi:hypothetical protein